MEPNIATQATIGPARKKSALLPIGIILIVVGLFLPERLWNVATQLRPGDVRSVLFISTDLFRLCFFAGVACTIIGVLRNRKKPVEPGS